jgi:hypothetical protein
MFRAEGTPKPSLRIPASFRACPPGRGFPPLKPRTQRRAALWNSAQREASPWNPHTKAVPSLAPLPNRAPVGIAPASQPRRTGSQGRLLGCEWTKRETRVVNVRLCLCRSPPPRRAASGENATANKTSPYFRFLLFSIIATTVPFREDD